MAKKPKILHAVVAPVKKQVYIFLGKKLLKKYRCKRDIPSKKVMKEFEGYDYGCWTVSDRGYTYEKEVTEWDNEVMTEIRTEALRIYKEENKHIK